MKRLAPATCSAAAAVVLLASAAIAQGPGRGFASRTGGESPNDSTYLLAFESVQKELALTDEQKDSLKKLREEENIRHPFAGGFIGQSPDAIQKKLEEHATENRERVAKILTPEQVKRLNEINIQVVGAGALSFDDVAKKLDLTADQKTKLKKVAEESRRKLSELNAPNNGRPVAAENRQNFMKKLSEITAERKNQSMAVLTADQKAKFEKLKGKTFDITTIQRNSRNFSRRGRIEAPALPNAQPAVQQ
jgi:Spy/CpxP family protein refolding chaperone